MGRHALARRGADPPPPPPRRDRRVAHPRRLTWNTDYGGFATLWTGSGEAEALGELFFDNLATLLSVSSYVDSSLAQWQNRSKLTHTATLPS